MTLDYAPDATGTADITVRASDTGFPVRFVDTTFTVNLTEVNDTPTLSSGSLDDLTVVRNSPATSFGLSGLGYGAGGGADESGQTLSYMVTTLPSSTLGTVMLSDGTTEVTPGTYTLAQIQGMQFQAAANTLGGPGEFRFTVTDNGTTHAVADPQTLTQSLQIRVIEFVPDPTILQVQVAASTDDAEERVGGRVTVGSSDLELVEDATTQHVGLRFTGVNIPRAAVIQHAYLQFQADETSSIATSLVIHGEDSDNAPTFSKASADISSRARTTAAVSWSPAPWTVRGEAGPNQRTGDISTVILEIVNRPGWSSGNSLAIIIAGSGKRTAESFNGVPSAAPRLHVEYLPPRNQPPRAVEDSATTIQNTPVMVAVLINDNPGDSPASITGVTQGSHGTVTFDPVEGLITYTPETDFIGSDSYMYTITDADGETSSATVSITVRDPIAPASIDIRVMGDVPYRPSDYAPLEADLANVAATDEFFAHVGDIQSGDTLCEETVYAAVASILRTSAKPVFILPGDNDWNDCADPDQAWTYWEAHLSRLEGNWSHGFNVLRQPTRDENFAFTRSGVLFIGINLVAGRVHDENEWAARMTDDANWVSQNFNDFGDQVTSAVVFGHAFPNPAGGHRKQFGRDFVTAAQNFGKPILYAMGDLHSFQLDQPFIDAPNVTRLVVDQGPAIRVTITHDPTEPFLFNQSALKVQSTGPVQPGAEPLEQEQLAPIVSEALVRLSRSAIPVPVHLGLAFEVVDLPGRLLGRATTGVVQIDVDAAGFGWHIDTTPQDNSEFTNDSDTPQLVGRAGGVASERVDLLTAVMHELGHVFGLEHTAVHGVMDAELPLGTRRLP